MEMRYICKRIALSCLCIALLCGLCACSKQDWIFSLNGEMLYEKDVTIFGYIYAVEYNLHDKEQLDAIYEGTTTYGAYCKEQLEEDIILTVLLYKEAKKEKVKLSKEDETQLAVNVDKVLECFGEESLEEEGISKSDIEAVYEMKMLGAAYLSTLSNGENETEDEEEPNSERYVKVFQVTFPTVALDEEGMVQSDNDGSLKQLSTAEVTQKQQEAETFAEAAKQGEDMKELLKDYDVTVTGIEKYMKYEDMEQAYKTAVDEMSVGEVSDVIRSDYGFYVVRLLEKEDVTYSQMMERHATESKALNAKKEWIEKLYAEYAEANKEYKNAEVWKAITMEQFID